MAETEAQRPMVVAVVIVLGAAITWVAVMPLMCRPRIIGEYVGPGFLRTYAGAQNMYRRTDYDGDGVFEYAFPYTLLNTTIAAGQPIRLIDDAFANASRDTPPSGTTTPKAGYLFVDVVRDAAEGSYYDGRGNYVRGYGLCAYPAEYGRTGRNTYVIDVRGTVYWKDTGGKPVVVFPDVEREGWEPP